MKCRLILCILIVLSIQLVLSHAVKKSTHKMKTYMERVARKRCGPKCRQKRRNRRARRNQARRKQEDLDNRILPNVKTDECGPVGNACYQVNNKKCGRIVWDKPFYREECDDMKEDDDDSSYADTGAHYSHSATGQQLPGNTQEKVLVEQRLFVYLKTFEQFIAKKDPSIEYRNLARTGVKIKGVPYLNYEQALEWIGSPSNTPFCEKIRLLLDQQRKCPDLTEVFKPAKDYVQELLEKALSAAIETEMLPAKLESTNYSNHKSVRGLIEKGGEINRIVDSNKNFWSLLLEGKTKSELVVYQRILRDIDFPNKNWKAIQGNKEYFWALTEGCHWLLETLNASLQHESSVISAEQTP